MNDLSAVLLCGGESRRMGRDKATLTWRGQPFWAWQLAKLRELQPTTIFISAREEPSWLPADVLFVADKPPSCGPLSGIAATLAICDSAHLLTFGIDLPAMTGAHLQHLCGLVRPGVGVSPVIGDRAEPLAAIYPSEAREDFIQALSGAEASLQPIVRKLIEAGKLRTVAIARGDQGLYHNVNEPRDLDQ